MQEILDAAVKRYVSAARIGRVSRVHGHISTDSRCAESARATRKGRKGRREVEERGDRATFCSYLARTKLSRELKFCRGATNNYQPLRR